MHLRAFVVYLPCDIPSASASFRTLAEAVFYNSRRREIIAVYGMSSYETQEGVSPAIELESGQRIDERFEVLGPLGAGGGGAVLRVKDLQSGGELALKILAPEHAEGPTLRRFVREYRVASRLKDGRLVRAYHFGKFANTYFFTMDYVAGGSLSRQIKGKKLPPGMAAGIILQLLAALDALHQRNITHRDIKPLNILLEGPLPIPAREEELLQALPPVRLTDFGIARFGDLTDEEKVGRATGTPRYRG
jgi:serine/threonine protein kinase